MNNLASLSKIGFGGYRVSVKSEEHYQALYEALKEGCNVIDTSANYTDGDSERLIGKVLEEHPEFDPFIITKAGYIQGETLASINELSHNGKEMEDLVDLGEELKHSIHPHFLENQIQGSLERLGRSKVGALLLHNPEYYFKQEEEVSQKEYYQRIRKAFEYLESKVEEGVIECYGISSNNFTLNTNDPEVTNLNKVLKLAKSISKKNHFKIIQFPLNIYETGAIEKIHDGKKLLDIAKSHKLTTFVNRPLNAFSEDGLVRLATYENFHQELDDQDINDIFEVCCKLIKNKWLDTRIPKDFDELPLIKQFKEVWRDLPTPDAVDQVFYAHLFPFLIQLWGGKLSTEDSRPFSLLYETTMVLTRDRMTDQAKKIRKDFIEQGILPTNDLRSLAVLVCDKYLQDGADHVLVGMRKSDYVQQLKELF